MADRIERELVLPAPPEDIWEVVTGPGWLAEEVDLELVPGGDACFRSEDGVRLGWVEQAIPPGQEAPARLAFWWSADQEPASRVELTLEPEGESATRLRVIEERPLEVLDVVGIPLPGLGGSTPGPLMLSLA
jgi:uncharacterized protein YndB with AHSA1/START domain